MNECIRSVKKKKKKTFCYFKNITGDTNRIPCWPKELHMYQRGLLHQHMELKSVCWSGVCCCSYGVVLKELTDKVTAHEMFVKSLSMEPLLWCSWKELAKLCEDREMVRFAV